MATREETVRTLLALGDDIEANYDATANRAQITEAGSLVRSTADRLVAIPTVEYHQGERADRSNWLTRFKNVLDSTLTWLEHCGGQISAQKLEQVLRGLYNLTELGNQAHLFVIIELACACLDKPDPFPGKRQYVLQCFQDVKAQQEQIGSLVEQASALLNEILQNKEVDYIKGRQFDNVIREARVLIESCKRRLTGAEQAISELSDKMGTVKWASRGLRATGWAFSSYFFFKRYQESNHSSMDLLMFVGCVSVSGWLCMSLFSGRASVFNESLSKLQTDHQTLQEKLEDLKVSLKSTKDHRDGL